LVRDSKTGGIGSAYRILLDIGLWIGLGVDKAVVLSRFVRVPPGVCEFSRMYSP